MLLRLKSFSRNKTSHEILQSTPNLPACTRGPIKPHRVPHELDHVQSPLSISLFV